MQAMYSVGSPDEQALAGWMDKLGRDSPIDSKAS